MRRKDEMVELRERYLNGNRLIKREILDGLCTVHGYHRKAAIRHLNAEVTRLASGKPKRVGKRGRRSRYQGDPGFEAVLKAVWAETDYMCSTNLVKARHEWLPAYEEEYGTLRADIRERILTVSSSTIDRILKPYKYRGRGRCGKKQEHFYGSRSLSPRRYGTSPNLASLRVIPLLTVVAPYRGSSHGV